jgi:hypothetical protein
MFVDCSFFDLYYKTNKQTNKQTNKTNNQQYAGFVPSAC